MRPADPAGHAAGSAGRSLLWVGLIAALLIFPGLGARDLWNPNEPTYGLAVAEMHEAGAWLIPTVGGEPFVEKPALYYWLARVCVLLLGLNEWALRLPLAVTGLVGVLFFYLFARRQIPAWAGWATALFATTYMVFWGARSIQMDLMVMVATLCSVGLLYGSTFPGGGRGSRPWRREWAWPLAGLAAGLGVAAKGPVALVLPLLIYLPFVLIERYTAGGEESPPAGWHPLVSGALAFGVFLLAAEPWYLALGMTGNWDLLMEVLFRQNVTRFVDAWDHAQPWWYYLYYLPIDMAPWIWWVPFAIGLPGRSDAERRLHRLSGWWIFAVVLFFSLADSKRSAYILPVAPAVAWLAASVLARLDRGTLGVARRLGALAVFVAVGALMLIAALAGRPQLIERYPDLAVEARVLVGMISAGGALVLLASIWPGHRGRFTPRAFLAFVAALYLVAGLWFLPAANRYKSPRVFAEQLQQAVPAAAELRSWGFWRYRGSYMFYARRTIPNLEGLDELRDYWERSAPVCLLLHDDRLEAASPVLGTTPPRLRRAIGSRTVYLFCRDEPVTAIAGRVVPQGVGRLPRPPAVR